MDDIDPITPHRFATTVDLLLLEISHQRASFHVSCDLYHDDYAPEDEAFVVRLSSFQDEPNDVLHFRAPCAVEALLHASTSLRKRRARYRERHNAA